VSGAEDSSIRDRETIERELRLLADVRDAYRERGKETPSLAQIDALLDELNEVDGIGKHRWENDNSDARPSLWR
jgi:hypothetical protein